MTHQTCFACGARLPPVDGPTHGYMDSSAGCWAAFGSVLAREYSDPELFARSHRLTVDAYAVQHPGDLSAQRTRQSVWLHLASLHAVLDLGWSHDEATAMLKALAGRAFPQPRVVPLQFEITVELPWSRPVADHEASVSAWAEAALLAWRRADGADMQYVATLLAAAQGPR